MLGNILWNTKKGPHCFVLAVGCGYRPSSLLNSLWTGISSGDGQARDLLQSDTAHIMELPRQLQQVNPKMEAWV